MPNIQESSPEKDPLPTMSEVVSGLLRKYSGQIWDFLLADDRRTYLVQVKDLPEASDEFKDLITSRQVSLDKLESEALDYYSIEGKKWLADFRYEHRQIVDLANYESIYPSHTISLSSSESRMRLGSIIVSGSGEATATILVPQEYDRYLNLRSAVGTLSRSIVDVADDTNEVTLKIPGLLALDTIKGYVETEHDNDLAFRNQGGQYL
jgi:hypothetical protein